MTTISLPDDVAEDLTRIAHAKGLPLADYLRDIAVRDAHAAERELLPLDDFIGMIDVDVTDASSTVKETVRAHFRKKHGGSDDDPR